MATVVFVCTIQVRAVLVVTQALAPPEILEMQAPLGVLGLVQIPPHLDIRFRVELPETAGMAELEAPKETQVTVAEMANICAVGRAVAPTVSAPQVMAAVPAVGMALRVKYLLHTEVVAAVAVPVQRTTVETLPLAQGGLGALQAAEVVGVVDLLRLMEDLALRQQALELEVEEEVVPDRHHQITPLEAVAVAVVAVETRATPATPAIRALPQTP